ncbi:septum formation inhibitor Maf [Patescibacteria group bacterium]|nr:septum formation inhibitor Maf [Patescibacteria group bacterium]
MKIILASKSIRRKELLKNIGLKFKVIESGVDEERFTGLFPGEFVKKVSLEKAKEVYKKNKDSVIIAADTIVVLGSEIIGKPKDKKDAERILNKLSGKTHEVITGFTILSSNKLISKLVESKVTFKKLSKEEISAYVNTNEPMDKAGAYGIQDRASVFVEKLEGDFFNVVGLPIFAVVKQLKNFKVEIYDFWH